MHTQRIEVYPKTFDNIISNEIEYDQYYSSYYVVSCSQNIPLDILKEVLSNPLEEDVFLSHTGLDSLYDHVIDVSFLRGVTDNVATTTKEAFTLFGYDVDVTSGKLFFLNSDQDKQDIINTASQVIFNPLINTVNIQSKHDFLTQDRFSKVKSMDRNIHIDNSIDTINLDLSDRELLEISNSRCLALSLDEMKAIKDYYLQNSDQRKDKGLPLWPTDVELECLAQTWSEHCKHKIFNARIDFSNNIDGQNLKVNSLFKQYIRSTTELIQKERNLDWLISIFHDNAGIVRFDKNIDVCFKVETHNSPSALDPYGGALTGILGVNRDILGCGLGAKPIANTNVFCLGAPGLFDHIQQDQRPRDLIRPEDILTGIHKGVEDGGNKSGIPTINGAMSFHDSYSGKPLVYVGSLGFMPQEIKGRKTHIKEINSGDLIYVAGGRVGSDGIHGATFSSMDLNEESPTNAVQIGDPITQKRLMDFLLEARDQGLITAITDNGAGGLSSSIGEMAELSNGATLYLDRVPLKYSGLSPWEVLISESQERMSFAISPLHAKNFEELASKRNVEVANIGIFHDTGKLDILVNDECCASLPLDFLHNGLPEMSLTAVWDGPLDYHHPFSKKLESTDSDSSLMEQLRKVISHGDIASKEKWIRKYDHEVGGNTAVRPLEKKNQTAPNNCGVISMEKLGGEKNNGIALGLGMASRLSPFDPKLMAKLSVDESLRNIICQGADPEYIAVLDNFCWPDSIESLTNPDGKAKLAQLVLAAEGLRESCIAYGTPLISGKDSMKNDYRGKDSSDRDIKISVLPTLLVSSLGKINLDEITSSSIQNVGDEVILVGQNDGGLTGSIYSEFFESDPLLPTCNLDINKKIFSCIHKLIQNGLVSHCADISDGGLITAISEQLFLNRLGLSLKTPFSIPELFNESGGRFIISINPADKIRVEEILSSIPYQSLGIVDDSFTLVHDEEVIDLSETYNAWNDGVLNFSEEFSYEC